ncbi:hypothetical protein ABK040_006417 [Willaertia magna]
MASFTNTKAKAQETDLLIVEKTFFFNKTQDIALSKFIFDTRNEKEYEESHIRSSASLSLIEKRNELIQLYNETNELDEIITELTTPEVTYNILPINETHLNRMKDLKQKITMGLNEILKNSMFKLRGLVYKTILLYGYDLDYNSLTSTICVEENTNIELVPFPRTIKTLNEQDIENHLVLLLAGLLKREGKVDFIYVLNNYNNFCEKYPFLLTTKEKGLGTQEMYPSEIVEDFLFLGDKNNSSSHNQLSQLGINYILNMAEEVFNTLTEDENSKEMNLYKYLKLGTGDTISDTIDSLFEKANEFIRNAKENNGRVIVNCNMGVSRSSTIVINFLMNYFNLSFEEALSHSKQQRSVVNPNQAFRSQLQKYYNK